MWYYIAPLLGIWNIALVRLQEGTASEGQENESVADCPLILRMLESLNILLFLLTGGPLCGCPY